MAQKVLVQLVDDLDGSSTDTIETVTFGLDGVNYEIDLGPKNAAALRRQLSDFVDSGRRIGGRLKRGTASATAAKPAADREQTRAVREWAVKNGYQISSRGRIPANIIDAFEQAHHSPARRKGRGNRKAAMPAFSS